MDESYEDPRYGSSQGRWVGGGDAGGYWEPLTVATPLGQYVGSGDSGGGWEEFSAQQRADIAAQKESARQSELQGASAYLAANPLSISGDQIDTRYGQKNVSYFNPIVKEGEAITGSTPTQMIDPQTKQPVFLSDPNDPFSYTYNPTGTPAIGGTVEQQAALYRPVENKGVFGTLGGDLLSAVKDPYFHKFLAAAAAMAGGAALSAQGAGAGAGAAGAGGEAGSFIAADMAANAAGQGAFDLAASLGMPLDQAVTQGLITGSGALTDAGAAALLGTGGTTATTGLGSTLKSIAASPAFQAARLALPVVGALTSAARAGQAGGQGGGQGGQGGGQGGQGGGGQGYTQGPWNTFMTPTTIRQEGSGTTVMQNPELAMLEPSLANQLAQSGAIPSNLAGSNVPSVNYYSYGTPPQTDYFGQTAESPLMAASGGSIKKPQKLAMGGMLSPEESEEPDGQHIPEFITGATGFYVKGRGDGQSDDIPAMLADGEYVFDADTVAQLGNGSSDAGAKFLDSFRHAVREHKRSAPVDKIPPKASPLQYVKEAMKRTT
jgi:hypothetical protein